MKNYILSDIHLEENEKDFFITKRVEILKENISNIIKNKAKRVFLNGDTFHKENIKANSEVVKIFIEDIILPLLDNNIEIHILLWNHERGWFWDTFSFLKWELSNPLIHIYDDIKSVEFDDFNAIFVPFMYRWDRDVNTIQKLEEIVEIEIKEKINKLKDNNKDKPVIIFNHNMMSDLPFDEGREMNIKLWEFKGVDFVFWWHIHKYEVFKKGEEDKGLYVWALMRSFVYEEETEGYVWFEIKDKKINYEYIKNLSYNHEKIEIEDWIDFDISQIKENTIYDIIFKYKSDSETFDEYFIQNIFNEIKKRWSYVKKHAIVSIDSDIKLSQTVTFITSLEDILKDFLKDNNIKDKKVKDSYLDKLEQCKSIININKNWKKLEKENKKEEDTIIKDTKNINNINSLIWKGNLWL